MHIFLYTIPHIIRKQYVCVYDENPAQIELYKIKDDKNHKRVCRASLHEPGVLFNPQIHKQINQ